MTELVAGEAGIGKTRLVNDLAHAVTGRETDVLRLLSEARTNREIGEALFISPKTATEHVSSTVRKLGVRRRADAARVARKPALEERTP